MKIKKIYKMLLIINIILICNSKTVFASDLTFDSTMDLVNDLEELAHQYVTINPNENPYSLMYSYIRSERYNSFSWMLLAGSINYDFDTYVSTHQTKDISQLKYIDYLTLPNGEQLDFIHMIGSMNMALYGNGDFGSWCGDIVQLGGNMKNNIGDIHQLKIISDNLLGTKNSSFDYSDIISDIDAINLHNRWKTSSLNVANIMREYYSNLNLNKRTNEFITTYLTLPENTTQETIRSIIKNKFDNISLLSMLRGNYGIDDISYDNHINACLYSFADFLHKNFYRDINKNDIYLSYPTKININDIKNNDFICYLTKEFKTNDNLKIENLTQDVIEINNNKIIPNNIGTGVIKLSGNSYIENLYINIVDEITSLSIKEKDIVLFSDEIKQIIVSTIPSNRTCYTFLSEDESIAKVDKNGNIIPISEGKCKIYCNSTDGSELSTVVNIEVKYKIPSLQIDTSCNKNQFSKKDTVFIKLKLYNDGEIDLDNLNITIGGREFKTSIKIGETKEILFEYKNFYFMKKSNKENIKITFTKNDFYNNPNNIDLTSIEKIKIAVIQNTNFYKNMIYSTTHTNHSTFYIKPYNPIITNLNQSIFEKYYKITKFI